MTKQKETYPQVKKETHSDINDIRDDLSSLKDNIIELTKHLKESGTAQSKEIADLAMKQIEELQHAGSKQIKNIEKQVKAKPGQALAVAFVSGLLLTLMLKGR